MINVSNAFKEEIKNENRNYIININISLTDGTEIELGNPQIWNGGFSIEDGVSGNSSFEIGGAIINKLTLVINNIDESYTNYVFDEAKVIAKIGLKLPDNTTESINKGIFIVNDVAYNGALITLTCLDYMSKFDRPYSESKLEYPATLSEIVRDICSRHNITFVTTSFRNSQYQIDVRPDPEAITDREVLQWCAQIAACWARFDNMGQLHFEWYDTSPIVSLYNLITSDSDKILTVDDKNIIALHRSQKEDFLNDNIYTTNIHRITNISSKNVSLDDVVITGIRVVSNTSDSEDQIFGYKGYVLSIENNHLIEDGKEQEIAKLIGENVVGMRFRPLSISCLNDPTIEAGDRAYIIDEKSNVYTTYITSTVFSIGKYQTISCNAETPERNKAARYSQMTKAIVESRKTAEKLMNSYESAAINMMQLISQGYGLYFTIEIEEDGSKRPYMHDKPTIEESSVVWTITSNGLMVSKDGGITWGVDVNGNALFNVITAHGINADWINTGTLTVGGNGNVGNIRILNSSGSQIGNWGANGISATAGSIAGYRINGNDIYHSNDGSSHGIGMSANPGKYAFWAGETSNSNGSSGSNAPFRVGNNGSLYAADATISGTVNASSGNFNNITVNGSTWSGGNVNSASVNSPSISGGSYSNGSLSGGSYSSGNMYGCNVPSGSALYMGNSSNYIDYTSSGQVRITAGGSAGVAITGSATMFQGGSVSVLQNLYVTGALAVSGNKGRLIKTQHYGNRVISAFETPLPTFSDYGKGKISEDGYCYITIDTIFEEMINKNIEPTLFLTK